VDQGRKRKKLLYSHVLCVLTLVLLSSCSWITSGRSLFGGEDETSDVIPSRDTVPREQYQQLLGKYEKLLSSHKKQSMPQESNPNSAKLLNQLSDVEKKADLVETVDVFKKEPSRVGIDSRIKTMPIVESRNYENIDVEGQITSLRKSKVLISKNKYDEAFKILKELEASPVRQIKVRAKFQLGEILFSQGEYDLSMQIYEEVIHNDAFSGIVIKTLGRLIVCSEKLRLDKKKEQYYSILHDFFEAA